MFSPRNIDPYGNILECCHFTLLSATVPFSSHIWIQMLLHLTRDREIFGNSVHAERPMFAACSPAREPGIYNTIRCISIMNLNFVTKYWSVVSIICIGEDLAVQASRSLLFHSEIMWDVKTFWLDLSEVFFFYPSALSVLGNNSCNWLCLHVFQGIDRLSV